MGRWRPPTAKSAPYITPQGYRALEQELGALWLRRRDVVQALSEAAAEGDRSENAEYIYRKKELGGIDRRIRYIQKRLPDLTIVQPRGEQTDQVFFGAQIDLEDDAGESMQIRIVGADEIDAGKGSISVDAPLARALLGKRQGDEVSVTVDGRRQVYVIAQVGYSS